MVRKLTHMAGGWSKHVAPLALAAPSTNHLLHAPWTTDAFCARLATRLTANLPRSLPPDTLRAVATAADAVVTAELAELALPTTAPTDPIDAVHHRTKAHALTALLQHPGDAFARWVDTVAALFLFIAARVPPGHDRAAHAVTLTARFIDLIPNQNEFVAHVVHELLLFSNHNLTVIVPGAGLAGQVQQALLRISKLTFEAATKTPHRLVSPADSGLTGSELVAAYLSNTPFFGLLTTPVPFSLPAEKRYAGHYIIAPSGQGKTTLLHSMLSEDVKTDACIIVMDSKGDLVTPMKTLALVKERLLIIEPDSEFPLALNPLDIPKANVNHVISLLEYVFSALLEAKMTALQMTLFRTLLPAIVQTVPNPTLQTFIDIVTNGVGKYQQHFATLPEHERSFFYDKETGFLSKTYTDTRNQLIWRLQFLMSNPIIKQMFTAPKTKLDIGKEMDAGKVILINNSKRTLGDEGAEFFGRFFIALILAAAEQRSGRPQSKKRPCFVYIDECQNVIKRDEKISTILDECRSQKIGMILAHQRTDQILSENVLGALANCAIRMANSDDEAKYLADKLRTDIGMLRSLPVGSFATYVRGLTSSGLMLKVPDVHLSQLPRMSAGEEAAIRARMRAEYSFVTGAPSPLPNASDRWQHSVVPRTAQTDRDEPRQAPTKRDRSRPPRDGSPETGAKW